MAVDTEYPSNSSCLWPFRKLSKLTHLFRSYFKLEWEGPVLDGSNKPTKEVKGKQHSSESRLHHHHHHLSPHTSLPLLPELTGFIRFLPTKAACPQILGTRPTAC